MHIGVIGPIIEIINTTSNIVANIEKIGCSSITFFIVPCWSIINSIEIGLYFPTKYIISITNNEEITKIIERLLNIEFNTAILIDYIINAIYKPLHLIKII